MSPIRILVVDNNGPLSSIMNSEFGGETQMKLTGIYSSPQRALLVADWAQVDVVIAGASPAENTWVALISQLKQIAPRVPCLVHLSRKDEKFILEAYMAGAGGFFLHDCSVMELSVAIRSVVAGGFPISPAIAKCLLDLCLPRMPSSASNPLTTRELQIISLLAKGNLYKEIAGSLGISHHTVHAHIKCIYKKLEVSGKMKAVQRAKESGFLG